MNMRKDEEGSSSGICKVRAASPIHGDFISSMSISMSMIVSNENDNNNANVNANANAKKRIMSFLTMETWVPWI